MMLEEAVEEQTFLRGEINDLEGFIKNLQTQTKQMRDEMDNLKRLKVCVCVLCTCTLSKMHTHTHAHYTPTRAAGTSSWRRLCPRWTLSNGSRPPPMRSSTRAWSSCSSKACCVVYVHTI